MPVRVVDAYVESLDLGDLGFSGVDPKSIGRPAYHPTVLLKLYIYGDSNPVQSSQRLEREAGRNVEVMWRLGRLVSRSQNDRGVSPEQRPCHSQSLRPVC